MKFPVLKGKDTGFPKKARCPWCKRNKVLEPHSMAIFEGGACLSDKKSKVSGPAKQMESFLYLAWHGAHDGGTGRDAEMFAAVDIVKDVRGGQFSLYFCSTDCLRAFLNSCVDELDRKKQRRRRSSRPSNNRPKNAARRTRATPLGVAESWCSPGEPLSRPGWCGSACVRTLAQ